MIVLSTIGDIEEAFRIGQSYVSALVWPVVVVIGLFLFRKQLRGLIDRIQKFRTPGGGEFDTPTQPQEPQSPPPGEPPPPNESITETATAAPPDASPYVFYWYYEKTYRLLFGTQIRLLEEVNKSPGGVHYSDLFRFHQEHIELVRQVDSNYQYDWSRFMGFLLNSQLIRLDNERYFITDLGKSFLQWKVAESLPDKGG